MGANHIHQRPPEYDKSASTREDAELWQGIKHYSLVTAVCFACFVAGMGIGGWL